jgi:hypothetical protein
MASKPHPWKGEKMSEYGFTLRYVPPINILGDAQMIFELTEFHNGTAVSFREILEVDVDVDPTALAYAPGPEWMKHLLLAAADMIDSEPPDDDEVTDDPAVVKDALASRIPPVAP